MTKIVVVDAPTEETTPVGRRHYFGKIVPVAVLSVVVLVGALLVVHNRHNVSPVPISIRNRLTFPVYYPEQNKLPAGYSLDTTSFRLAQPGVCIYAVTHLAEHYIFSEEASPGSSVIDRFNASAIALHTTQNTRLGQAEFGAYGSGNSLHTIASLPITKGPWLIITAPADASHDDLVQIINSLTK